MGDQEPTKPSALARARSSTPKLFFARGTPLEDTTVDTESLLRVSIHRDTQDYRNYNL